MDKEALITLIEEDEKYHNAYTEIRELIGEDAYSLVYQLYTSEDESADRYYYCEMLGSLICEYRDGIIENRYADRFSQDELDTMVEMIEDEIVACVLDDIVEDVKEL